MGLWSPSAPIPTVEHVPMTLTNRLYPLPDGRDLTWTHLPIENSAGVVILDRNTDGHLDGDPITDVELQEILDAHNLG